MFFSYGKRKFLLEKKKTERKDKENLLVIEKQERQKCFKKVRKKEEELAISKNCYQLFFVSKNI